MNRARSVSKINDSISPNQKRKIEETYKKDIGRAIKSETFKAMDHDVKMFGKKAFKKED